jgi:hypothetical protein
MAITIYRRWLVSPLTIIHKKFGNLLWFGSHSVIFSFHLPTVVAEAACPLSYRSTWFLQKAVLGFSRSYTLEIVTFVAKRFLNFLILWKEITVPKPSMKIFYSTNTEAQSTTVVTFRSASVYLVNCSAHWLLLWRSAKGTCLAQLP